MNVQNSDNFRPVLLAIVTSQPPEQAVDSITRLMVPRFSATSTATVAQSSRPSPNPAAPASTEVDANGWYTLPEAASYIGVGVQMMRRILNAKKETFDYRRGDNNRLELAGHALIALKIARESDARGKRRGSEQEGGDDEGAASDLSSGGVRGVRLDITSDDDDDEE